MKFTHRWLQSGTFSHDNARRVQYVRMSGNLRTAREQVAQVFAVPGWRHTCLLRRTRMLGCEQRQDNLECATVNRIGGMRGKRTSLPHGRHTRVIPLRIAARPTDGRVKHVAVLIDMSNHRDTVARTGWTVRPIEMEIQPSWGHGRHLRCHRGYHAGPGKRTRGLEPDNRGSFLSNGRKADGQNGNSQKNAFHIQSPTIVFLTSGPVQVARPTSGS
ncbi:hypothetical protein BamIOP4010DRAFT_0503 [Burkholderia ambifaria IOP40-10]|uniref:Uncharacterized protein n=1 Tax=Burkholderia ambifaria IOP40-10 TaxID=396596 RepID=B1F8Z4_9BURK|nr:hypothetical protein BamIOP4010DRAFT_0503 [Burkholderia ambifaria IOP40-10]